MAFIAAAFNPYFTGFFHAHPADGADVFPNEAAIRFCICRGCIYDYSAFIFVNTTLIN